MRLGGRFRRSRDGFALLIFFLIVSHIFFLPLHQVNPWSHGKCGGILAAVGDVKAASPLLPI